MQGNKECEGRFLKNLKETNTAMSKKKIKSKKKQHNLVSIYNSFGVEIPPMGPSATHRVGLFDSVKNAPIPRTYSTFEFEKQKNKYHHE